MFHPYLFSLPIALSVKNPLNNPNKTATTKNNECGKMILCASNTIFLFVFLYRVYGQGIYEAVKDLSPLYPLNKEK